MRSVRGIWTPSLSSSKVGIGDNDFEPARSLEGWAWRTGMMRVMIELTLSVGWQGTKISQPGKISTTSSIFTLRAEVEILSNRPADRFLVGEAELAARD